MGKLNEKVAARLRRKKRIRKNIHPERGVPRLTVFRSSKHIYAQIVDDIESRTLISASTISKAVASKAKATAGIEQAKLVGKHLAELASKGNIDKVCFDRNGFRYHGRIKALADAAREGGLKF